MPFTFVVDTFIQIIFVYGKGVITVEEMRALLHDIATTPYVTLPRLADLREAKIDLPPMLQPVAMRVS